MYNLIIDDELVHNNSYRHPNKIPNLCNISDQFLINKYFNEEWIFAATFQEAIAIIEQKGCPKFISFDNDLGNSSNGDGIDVAKWLVVKDLDNNGKFILPEFGYFVHSQNPIAAEQISGLLYNYLCTKC
jgi:hypothetical protein